MVILKCQFCRYLADKDLACRFCRGSGEVVRKLPVPASPKPPEKRCTISGRPVPSKSVAA